MALVEMMIARCVSSCIADGSTCPMPAFSVTTARMNSAALSLRSKGVSGHSRGRISRPFNSCNRARILPRVLRWLPATAMRRSNQNAGTKPGAGLASKTRMISAVVTIPSTSFAINCNFTRHPCSKIQACRFSSTPSKRLLVDTALMRSEIDCAAPVQLTVREKRSSGSACKSHRARQYRLRSKPRAACASAARMFWRDPAQHRRTADGICPKTLRIRLSDFSAFHFHFLMHLVLIST